MAKNNSTLYSTAKTFIWFAVISLILTASLVAIVVMDHSREWKDWQKKFIALKIDKAKNELKKADASIDKKKLESLKAQEETAHRAFKVRQKDYKALENEIAALDSKIVKTKTRFQDLKQFEDSYRYYFEEYAAHEDLRAASYEKKLKDLAPRLAKIKLELESLEKAKEAKEAIAKDFGAKEKEFEKQIDKLLEEKNRLENRIATLKPTLAKEILNAPMLDFMAPTLSIQQVVLDNLQDDYHFAKVQKVDRCMTCHLGIDQKGFENAPQPFKTHPKLDLYLGSSSAHPVEKFGCTVCHGGNGHSVSFKDSAHTPRSEAQKKDWEKKYHWRWLEKWEAKMLPLNHIEAACAKCHTQTLEVPQAPKLNQGRKLAETQGCLNCHKIEGLKMEGWKVGPDLQNVKSKLSREWMIRWLQDPKVFRPSTQMPAIFHLSNASSAEDRERNNAAIESIVAYLMENSGTVELPDLPAQGNAQEGERLIKDLGCLGCHSAAGVNANSFGPELSNLGSKVSAQWLYQWIKNPKHVSKDTRMPNFRLTDQEAADITAYLVAQRNEPFEAMEIPAANPKVVEELILNHLQSNLRRVDAEAELGRMSQEEKLQYLGKKSIAHQGCFGCHQIKGFEEAKPIGAELTHEGSKDIHQFDFGFTHLEHTRHDWILQKLKDPRVFDHGKIKGYYEKLRMPQFNFTDEEREALTTFLLSLTEEAIPLEMQKRPDLREQKIEKGRLLVSKFNCNGCHTLDGKTGGLWDLAEDKGAAPPILDGEGAKVQEKWLHEFLKNPSLIRPWLHTRMPTFDFTEEELTSLVEYFAYLAHEEVSYKGYPIPQAAPEKLEAGKVLFDKFQCAKCHQVTASAAAMGTSFLAPDLTLSKTRLKPEWVKKWLYDPQALQEGTMMPGFFPDGQSPLADILGGDANEQIEAIRDYLYRYETGANQKK
jgi:mono/diheme cytochrome c family protein/predicted  nucleic acid-binding Zn-ribbon protein